MTVAERVAERVAKGIALLGEDVDMIDPDTLCMATLHSCALGQVHGSYVTGLCHYWPDAKGDQRDSLAIAHGFERHEEGYGALTEAWQAALRERA